MRAAEKTIEFARSWVKGDFGKRQYMHYYLVVEKDASFLMKYSEQGPVLVGIRDKNGHVFIFASEAVSYTADEEIIQRHPLLIMIHEGEQFPYTCIHDNHLPNKASANLSKWKTLDQTFITNEQTSQPVAVSLIEIGEQKFVVVPEDPNREALNLVDWANYADVKKMTKNEKRLFCLVLHEVSKQTKTIAEVRGAYVDFAGDVAGQSVIDREWVYIPTEKQTIADLVGTKYTEALRTRPIPYHYGITSGIINPVKALDRIEYPFSGEMLDRYRNDNLINPVLYQNSPTRTIHADWKAWFRNEVDPELSESILKFIEDDDAWLDKNVEVIKPFILGQKFMNHVYTNTLLGQIFVLEEPNPSIMPTHVVYFKGAMLRNNKTALKSGAFTKVMPTPRNDSGYKIEEFKKWL